MTRKPFVFALSLLLAAQPILAQGNHRQTQELQGEAYKMQVEVPLTLVDLVFTNKRGDVLGLELEGDINDALEVYEDGKPQKIEFFEPSEAPLTTVLLVEATPLFGEYMRYQNLLATAIFLDELRKDDWVALVAYDIKPRLEVDFTHDKNEIYQKLKTLFVGGFSETNMYDAVIDTIGRLEDAETKLKTSIVIIGTGFDTFSKHQWDDVSRAAREHRTTIYCINTTWILERYLDRLDGYGYRTGAVRLNLFQARAQMEALARMTGGAAYQLRFETELPGIYKTIGGYLRTQHTIGYYPTNKNFDGKKRKIKVRLRPAFEEKIKRTNDVNGDGVIDKKDKKEKIIILHRTEYYPKKIE